MIMAVSLKWMLAAAAAVSLVACGRGRQPSGEAAEPTEAANRVPAPLSELSPATSAPAPSEDHRPVIAAFGDSLSAGFGLDPGQSFPDDLQRDLDAAGYKYRVVNLGVSGDTTTDGVERLPSVLAAHPVIVILEFGGNDGLRGLPVSAAQSNLEKMIQAIQASGAKVVLAGMTLPRNYGPEYIHAFEQMYVALANHYKLARIPFLLDGVGGNPNLMQRDGIHPTSRGAEIVANTVMRYLTPLLRKS
jgi:acyl-CoA thioesterase-1